MWSVHAQDTSEAYFAGLHARHLHSLMTACCPGDHPPTGGCQGYHHYHVCRRCLSVPIALRSKEFLDMTTLR